LDKTTGCTHVIGICGGREIFVEDISRHCAIDKAIGLAIREGIDLSNSFLVTSCRQTASTIKKGNFLRNTNSYKHRCPHRPSCKRS
jgi:formate dehydrogenase accessory protein FdhD